MGLGWFLWLVSCDEPPEGEDTGACVHEPALSYSNFGEAFLAKHCLGCHSSMLPAGLRNSAPVGVDFDVYSGVLTYWERIQARSVGEFASMPPGGGLTEEEKRLLEEEVAHSSPHNLDSPRPLIM